VVEAKRDDASPRLQVVISQQTQAYLECLAVRGTHGNTVPSVARTLIEMGIREALEKGHLTGDDRQKIQNAAPKP
jgi:hypothetical protein